MPATVSVRSIRLGVIVFFILIAVYYIYRPSSGTLIDPSTLGSKGRGEDTPQLPLDDADGRTSATGKLRQIGHAKAAFVSLVRNEELWEIVKSIRRVEDRFNRNYHYPWVFLNDVPFTEEFIEITSRMVSGETSYGISLL
jgi:alpha 1,2-mannosyltransferase